MKSICFLTHDLMTGGIESVLTDAVKALHKKYEVEVVSLFTSSRPSGTAFAV